MKAMKKISNFSGEEDVERWIDKFEVAVRIDGKEDKETDLLAMYLEGPAYDTWKGLTPAEKSDAKAIKDSLRDVFGLRRREAWRLALERKIKLGENIAVAAEEIMKNVSIACEGDPLQLAAGLMLFIALPEDVQIQAVLQRGNNLKLLRAFFPSQKRQ